MKYRLINYFDVWGNEIDGWEVNNQCVEFDDLWITDEASDKDILNYLLHNLTRGSDRFSFHI